MFKHSFGVSGAELLFHSKDKTEWHEQIHTQIQLCELSTTDRAKQVLYRSRDFRVKLCQCGKTDLRVTGSPGVNFCVTLDMSPDLQVGIHQINL